MEKNYELESNAKTMLQIRPSMKNYEVIMLASGAKKKLTKLEYEAYKAECEVYQKSYKLKVTEKEAEVEEEVKIEGNEPESEAIKTLKAEKKELQKSFKKLPAEKKVEKAAIKKRLKEINKDLKELEA